LKLDVKEFQKKVKPHARRRSRLDDFRAEIGELRDRGYSYAQIVDFLRANGVTVTAESVRRYQMAATGEREEETLSLLRRVATALEAGGNKDLAFEIDEHVALLTAGRLSVS